VQDRIIKLEQDDADMLMSSPVQYSLSQRKQSKFFVMEQVSNPLIKKKEDLIAQMME